MSLSAKQDNQIPICDIRTLHRAANRLGQRHRPVGNITLIAMN